MIRLAIYLAFGLLFHVLFHGPHLDARSAWTWLWILGWPLVMLFWAFVALSAAMPLILAGAWLKGRLS